MKKPIITKECLKPVTETRMLKKKPTITKECLKPITETRFLKMADLQYAEGRHYYVVSRHDFDDYVATKTTEEVKAMPSDAVTCFVIIRTPGNEPRLLFQYEFRYPTGQFLLSPPAGLVDKADLTASNEAFHESFEGSADGNAEHNFCERSCDINVEKQHNASQKTNKTPEADAMSSSFEAALIRAAKREIHEETGLTVKDTDRVFVVNPLLFSSPGMTDESNAIVCAVLDPDDLSDLGNDFAEATECFDGFELLTKEDAQRLLRTGQDKNGMYYSVYTWAALMYFLSGAWE